MMTRRNYTQWSDLQVSEITFALGTDRQGKPTITMLQLPGNTDVSFVTPACVTNWPRCTGDGNFGTMWGPTDVQKAKYSLDLTDGAINGVDNPNWTTSCSTSCTTTSSRYSGVRISLVRR
jgi:hypothetical protein